VPESVLNYDEKPILSSKCRVVTTCGDEIDGTLMFTDQDRIVFATSQGFFSKRYEASHYYHLFYIRNVRLESKFLRGKILVIEFENEVYRYEGVKRASRWREIIISRKKLAKAGEARVLEIKALLTSKETVGFQEIAEINQKYDFPSDFEEVKLIIMLMISEGVVRGVIDEENQLFINRAKLDREKIIKEYKIDFAALKALVEEKGLILKVLECPNCGGKVQAPEMGNIIRCEHCGKDIYAVDVFEKFKKML